MALIIHRCTACGHPDIYHLDPRAEHAVSCCHGGCPSHSPIYGAPEVLPTFNNGEELPHLHKPGEKVRLGLPLELCGCEACHQLYEQEKGSYQAPARRVS